MGSPPVFKVPWVAVDMIEEESDAVCTSKAGAALSVSAANFVLFSWNCVCMKSTDPLMSLTELDNEVINTVMTSMLVKGGLLYLRY